MPRVPSVSPATGKKTSDSFVHTVNANFVDNSGRTLLLRGVNLSGASKSPVGAPSYLLDGFWEAGEGGQYSFIGRPLDLRDGSADAHLARLRGWGFNMLRFPVSWEALEHEGPGKYDYEFMDYTVQVLRKCKEFGFKVYMDPHQDTWSRFSGGSGAPYWTLVACGMNPRNFTATQAAIIHCEYPLPHVPNPAALPAMIWNTNYGRLTSQTVFTLFFAGRQFAPRCTIDGQNIQDYLQSHFLNAFSKLAERIRDAGDLLDDCVIGWDSLNEPFEGLISWENLNANPEKQGSMLRMGTFPTPAQSFRLGMGKAQTLDSYEFGPFGPKKSGTVTVDPKGRTAWADPSIEVDGFHPKWHWTRDPAWKLGECIWAQHGVWDIETGFVLQPDYFRFDAEGQEVDFLQDFWLSHWRAYAQCIRQAHPEAIIFVQPPVFVHPPPIEEKDMNGRAAYSPHWYDGLTLISRHWNWFNADAFGLLRGKYKTPFQAIKIGESAIRKSFQEQLGVFKGDAGTLGLYPTIIGEIGIPFNLDGKAAYGKRKGDYSKHERALDASLNAGDGPNALNWTVWQYCPDATHLWGDGWNLEDLSLWSADDLRPRVIEPKMISLPNDRSDTSLLKSPYSLNIAEASSSTTYLAAMLPTNGVAVREERKMGSMGIRESPESSYEFLTDGARASRGFCRPWPVKTVGVPVDIKFDMTKADFTLVVKVDADDKPRAEGEIEQLATEIYVPLVHYAHQQRLGRVLQSLNEETLDLACDSSDELPPPTTSPSSLSMSVLSLQHALALIGPAAPVLDLLVTVSEGRWEVDGQTLRWWYSTPAPGQAMKEVSIRIQRNGGPIKTKDSGYGARRRGRWRSCFDRFCSDCRIM